MKKITKISILILFILFVLGITTSNARETINTQRRSYCMEQSIPDMDDWEYLGDMSSYSYPEYDPINGHAKAYIYGAKNDIKKKNANAENVDEDDIQDGIYHFINQGKKNYVSYLAEYFQKFKDNEKKLALTKDASAKTTVNVDNSIYGPIRIEYNYLYAESGNYYDEWGGFIYAFVDKDGNNISDKVKLCTLQPDGSYKNIKSTLISSDDDTNGYYIVKTGTYKNKDLYAVTNDRTLGRVYLQVRSYSIEYRADIKISLRKSAAATAQRGHVYCSECKNNSELISLDQYKWVLWRQFGEPMTTTVTTENSVCYNQNVFDYEDGYHREIQNTGKAEFLRNEYEATATVREEEEETYVTLPDGTTEVIPSTKYVCSKCGYSNTIKSDVNNHVNNNHLKTKYVYKMTTTIYHIWKGCSNTVPVWTDAAHGVQDGNVACGYIVLDGNHSSQTKEEVEMTVKKEIYGEEASLEIPFGVTIEVTKEWEDYENDYEVRPDTLHFNVYRSIDQNNWELLKENTDYYVVVNENDKGTTKWKAYITGLVIMDENENPYYFKVEELETLCYTPEHPEGNYPKMDEENPIYGYITIKNKLKKIDIAGYVWLDGQTGIKPAIPNNGIIDESEARLENIVVYLYYKNPIDGTISKIAETVTDENGYYKFSSEQYNLEIGRYYTEFYYDGIHYEDTIQVEKTIQEKAKDYFDYPMDTPIKETEKVSKAFEDVNNNSTIDRRKTFNSRFETITYKKSNDGTTLNYNYANKKSVLITNEDGKTTIKKEFQMTAETPLEVVYANVDNFNLGLVKRGTDIALSTDVYNAKVTINGQVTDYRYNNADNSIEIGAEETNENVSYNLNLYTSDYTYRIRDYVNTQEFQEKDYINNGENPGVKTGDDLRVYIVYELNLQNQSNKTTRINEVTYKYDEKYTFIGLQESSYSVQDAGNILTINTNGLSLNEGETETLYLIFEVKEAEQGVMLGDFYNKAEITSYSTDEGLIDVDSQPGNFVNDNQIEDDSDTAGGLTIKVPTDTIRKITGKVFDKDGNNVNDVIVQLIELKTINGKQYEYIWQETVSGAEKGKRLNADGTALEEYTYTKADGYYEFQGMIPGDYIVRFIYGDGTTYDMTENVIKYNGQDYKSMPDANYKAEWYNNSSYSEGASVARDNEARRLETMGYGVEIDASKGVLLKLLNNVTPETLNKTEKEILVSTYKNIYGEDITEITQDIINKLLKEQTLENTWMCAETSKIKIAVDTQDTTNLSANIEVNGQETGTYKNIIKDINLGLELRPETKIELKKYITGFKLIASNGQTLVNAYIDVNEYLDPNITDISGEVEGIKDHVTILNTVWQYEVAPTEINAVVDGANLEFEYTLVVRNTGADDYLSQELADAYNTKSTEEYKEILANKANEAKAAMKGGTYRTQIGNSLGNSYYVGGTGTGKVLTEVLDIRDYINNDLTFTTAGKVEIDENAPHTHRILRDDYSMQEIELKTILKTTETTGKMNNSGETKDAVMYKVALGKNPISSTGNLNFENYIAEVMSYTNAAGRRTMASTPGNAEIIDHEYREGRTHEIDEADTGRIQVGAATGEDETTNYIIIVAVAIGIIVVAIGAYVVKKYIIK